MYIYIKTDKRGVVTDFEHNSDATEDDWPMKFYDFSTTNPDLEKEGYIKTYLGNGEYKMFEDYHDLYTYSEHSLHQPFNIPQPSTATLQTQLGAVAAEGQKNGSDLNEMKSLLKEILEKE